MKAWFFQLLIAIDQLLNVLVTPFSKTAWADETLSSRSYRAWRDGKFFGFTMKIIDWLFSWQKLRADAVGHCHNAYLNEKERLNSPPELRGSNGA